MHVNTFLMKMEKMYLNKFLVVNKRIKDVCVHMIVE